jgi:hypothetical protein
MTDETLSHYKITHRVLEDIELAVLRARDKLDPRSEVGERNTLTALADELAALLHETEKHIKQATDQERPS